MSISLITDFVNIFMIHHHFVQGAVVDVPKGIDKIRLLQYLREKGASTLILPEEKETTKNNITMIP